MPKTVRMFGGTLLLDDNATAVLGQLTLSEESTIEMGTPGGGSARLTFASAGQWAAGKILRITGWDGAPAGGGEDQILFSAALSSAQLGQIQWVSTSGEGDVSGAFQLPSGEIVPATGQSAFALGSLRGGTRTEAFSAEVIGTAGTTYVVEAATNLISPVWIPVATNVGSFTFTNANSVLFPMRFYRIVRP
jgi:hypothetical protein